jgi:hypothetical protein
MFYLRVLDKRFFKNKIFKKTKILKKLKQNILLLKLSHKLSKTYFAILNQPYPLMTDFMLFFFNFDIFELKFYAQS